MALLESAAKTELVASLAAHFAKRQMSAFNIVGEDACRRHVEAAVDALERDVETGKFDALRSAATAFVSELLPKEMGYADLRAFARELRERVLALAPEDRRAAVEEWCYQHLAVCTTHFMVQRDGMLQRQAEKRDIERFESQLAELEVALAEKTQLLQLIREASTPVTSVVSGILVVPLVGTFDRRRAEILTERLLEEVGRARARVAILDISGVAVFDTDAAQLIIRLARLVGMLGAKVILVGISPNNARTIVDLGIELDQIVTCQALQDGLRTALALQRMKIVSMDPTR
jgi:anti-anti-sigma regulatory factor